MRLVLMDIRLGLRNLFRNPLFALAAISSLALGIGANTAIFTLVDQLLLRLLPVKDRSEGKTERVDGELVSRTYFPVLGVGADLGRVLTPDDDKIPGGHPIAVG